MSNDTSNMNPLGGKQGGAAQSGDRQQQADVGNSNSDSKNRQPSPSRDQGHSPAGSKKAEGSSDQAPSGSPRQTGESH